MTGHNHYPWCTCGWCVGGGGGGHSTGRSVGAEKVPKPGYSDEDRRQAAATLNQYRVHNYSSCFVNPNASCPVCGASVFFYSNSNGSRVFFDELGPPWSKHPCTDKGISSDAKVLNRPIRRRDDEIRKIVNAEKKSEIPFIPRRRKKRRGHWKLLVVLEVVIEDGVIRILLEDVSSESREKHRLTLFGTEKLLGEGDFVSRKGNVFSFPGGDNFESVEVLDGQVLGDLNDLEDGIDQDTIPDSPHEMLPSESRHFHYGAMSRKDLRDELTPVLEDFSQKGIIGPKLVAHYLNATSRRTACGSTWTPRLAFFLICMLGAPMEKSQRPRKQRRSSPNKKNFRAGPRMQDGKKNTNKKKKKADSQNGPEDWASKLSRLGRVVRAEDEGKK